MKIDREKILYGLNKDDKMLIVSILDKYDKYLKTKREISSNFFTNREIELFDNRVKKYNIDYHIIEKIEGSDKKIIGFGEKDKLEKHITIYHGVVNTKIEHKDILGTLFSFGLTHYTIGDIYINENEFYLTNLTRLNSFLENNFKQIKNNIIKLDIIDNVKIEKKFVDIEISINSLRIDAVISKLINISRSDSQDKIKNKDVLLNSKEINKYTVDIKENDVLSIRKYGKYIVSQVCGTTKKNKILLLVKKYM